MSDVYDASEVRVPNFKYEAKFVENWPNDLTNQTFYDNDIIERRTRIRYVSITINEPLTVRIMTISDEPNEDGYEDDMKLFPKIGDVVFLDPDIYSISELTIEETTKDTIPFRTTEIRVFGEYFLADCFIGFIVLQNCMVKSA